MTKSELPGKEKFKRLRNVYKTKSIRLGIILEVVNTYDKSNEKACHKVLSHPMCQAFYGFRDIL